MEKINNFQERFLLNLCLDDEDNKVAKTILKSPLGLSKKIFRVLFKNQFKEFKIIFTDLILSVINIDLETRKIIFFYYEGNYSIEPIRT